ncbi:MAG: VTC domain-containing protein [Planctomycetes bacterium]|nr:VTC domain-containing protein [Planctomycetota bacterium]
MNIITRRETKFELDADSAKRLRQIVGRYLPLFEYVRDVPASYLTTTYFDTDRLEFFKRASTSWEDNVKIRVREYSYRSEGGGIIVQPHCFLEIKRRRRGLVTKHRLRLPKSLLDDLLEGEDIWRDLVAAIPDNDAPPVRGIYEELQDFLKAHKVSPRSVVHYRRFVYQLDEWELRITFDDELAIYQPPGELYRHARTLSPDLDHRPCRRVGKVIMEIKCQAQHPAWLEDALRSFLPRNISKFTESINLLVS